MADSPDNTTPDVDLGAQIEAAIASNPDPTVQTIETKDRSTTRHSLKDQIEAMGLLEARKRRQRDGVFRVARFRG